MKDLRPNKWILARRPSRDVYFKVELEGEIQSLMEV
jgi:hypothetical protein